MEKVIEVREHPTLKGLLVRSDGYVKTRNKGWQKGTDNGIGYYLIGYNKKMYKVHRLVAETFIENPKPNEYNQIDHINQQRNDNRVSNLRWCNDAINKRNTSKNRCVYQYSKSGEFIKIWNYMVDAEQIGGFNNSLITLCCKGQRKSHGGYVWRYAEPNSEPSLWIQINN